MFSEKTSFLRGPRSGGTLKSGGGEPLPPGFGNLWTKPEAQRTPRLYWPRPCLSPSCAWPFLRRKRGTHRAWAWPAAFSIQFNTFPECLLCTRPTQMLEVWKDTKLTTNPLFRVPAISGARNAQEEISATRQSWLAPQHVPPGTTAQPGVCCPSPVLW